MNLIDRIFYWVIKNSLGGNYSYIMCNILFPPYEFVFDKDRNELVTKEQAIYKLIDFNRLDEITHQK